MKYKIFIKGIITAVLFMSLMLVGGTVNVNDSESIANNKIDLEKQNNSISAYKDKNVILKSGLLAEIDLEELKKSSSMIVYGAFNGKSEPFIIESVKGTESIFTDYYFDITYLLRGEDKSESVTIRIEGGTVGDTCVINELSPILKMGKNYLLFLKKPIKGGYTTKGNYYYINGGNQGIYVNDSIKDLSGDIGEKLIYMTDENEKNPNSLEFNSFKKSLDDYNKNTVVNEEYLKNKYINSLNNNLKNKIITEEEYSLCISEMNKYAQIRSDTK